MRRRWSAPRALGLLSLAATLVAGGLARGAAAQQPARPPSASAQAAAAAEARLRTQRDELERVRRERAELERRMSSLQSTAHSLTEEVTNLEEQRNATERLVRSLDEQLASIGDEVESTSGNLAQTEAQLTVKREVLRRRLVDIYKRGPLHTAEVLHSAHSFGDLVARYKYLHILARRDRALVQNVESLRNDIVSQRSLLVRLQEELERSRGEKSGEEQRLRALEEQRGRSLVQVQRTTQQMRNRLAQIQRDEARLSNVLASLETARRRAAALPNARPAAPSTLKTADLGRLNWPVAGEILYRFGRVVDAQSNTATRWNGVGIAAALGTSVRAVAAGEVVVADAIGTYGNTAVIVQHGGGDYSVYGSLQRVDVRKGAQVVQGQSVGTVGKADPDLPAHLHFEVRPQGRAVDPLEWLRGQGR
jgi:septal ring factor EnvC (AmiA/AmiB activator)